MSPSACYSKQCAFQYQNAPLYKCTNDSSNVVSQQVVDNRNDIYIDQPVLNDRFHFNNHVNRQLISDNNYWHYDLKMIYRDNYIHHNQNQFVRQQFNYADISYESSVMPGACMNLNCGQRFYDLGVCAAC